MNIVFSKYLDKNTDMLHSNIQSVQVESASSTEIVSTIIIWFTELIGPHGSMHIVA